MLRRYLFVCISLVSPFALAQELPEGFLYKGAGNKSISANAFHMDSIQFEQVDTSYQNFYYWDQKIRDSHYVQEDLGNIGTANRKLLFETTDKIGFRSGYNAFDLYAKKKEQQKFYNNLSPYTELYYTNGSKRLQVFEAEHAQNINPSWSVGGHLTRLSAAGTFTNNETKHNSIGFQTLYLAPSSRYGLMAAFLFNNLNANESGGLLNDSIFRVTPSFEPEFEVSHLENTSNQSIDRSIFFAQELMFGYKKVKELDSLQRFKILPNYKLVHELNWSDEQHIFREAKPDTNFFDAIYLDSAKTYDRTVVQHLSNTIYFKSLPVHWKDDTTRKRQFIVWDLGIRNEISYTNQNDLVGFYDVSNFALAKLRLYILSNLYAYAAIEKGISGKYSNNFKDHFGLRFTNKQESYVDVSYLRSEVSPTFKQEKFYGNHQRWFNSFGPIGTSKISAEGYSEEVHFGIGYSIANIDNFVYFNSNERPEQANKEVNVGAFHVQKDFYLGRFTLGTYYANQASTSAEVHLPEHYVRQRVSFQQTLFKVLYLDFGFDVYYFSEYESYAYQPSGSYYYLSNFKSGDYPYASAFIQAKIKRARLLFRYVDVAKGLYSNGYYTAESYPILGPAFQFGFSWRFFD